MKKYFNIVIICFLLAIMLIAQVGIAVNKHICYTENIVEYSLLHNAIHCENHLAKNTTSCCKKPKAITTDNINKNCCDEDVIYAVLDVDYQIVDVLALQLKSYVITLLNYVQSSVLLSIFHNDTGIHIKPPLLHFSSKVNLHLSCLSIFRI